MRNNGFELVKKVTPTSGATKSQVIATYVDRGARYVFASDFGSLAYRVMQAFDRHEMELNVERVLFDAFATETFQISDSVISDIVNSLEWFDVLQPLNTDGKECHDVERMPSACGEYSVQITGEWFNAKNRLVGYRLAVSDGLDIETDINVSLKRGHVAFRSYGISTLYGTFVKKPLATYALAEAQDLTKQLNTAKTYHTVEYRFNRCDAGIAC